VIPPKANADFVYGMEEVLDLYQQPFDPEEPVVCFDETSKQLLAETRTPLPMRPGEPLRYDTKYQRRGTVNLFMFFEPLANWRHKAGVGGSHPGQRDPYSGVQTWEHQRNHSGATVDWRFTTKDARIKLKRLYPSFKISYFTR
jgi:hypothetical protein